MYLILKILVQFNTPLVPTNSRVRRVNEDEGPQTMGDGKGVSGHHTTAARRYEGKPAHHKSIKTVAIHLSSSIQMGLAGCATHKLTND